MAEANNTSSRNIIIALILISFAGIAAVVYFAAGSGNPSDVAPATPTPVAPAVEIADANQDVIDATNNRDVTAEEGKRYKVLIVDSAREGFSGVTRIGGLVTFVPDTRPGDLAVIELTRVKKSTADGVVIELLERNQPVPAMPNRAPRDEQRAEQREDAPSDIVGKTFSGTITDIGRAGDGITYLNRKVVFVPGTAKGDQIEYLITEDAGRFARARVVSTSGVSSTEVNDPPVKSGEEHIVEITENDRRNPGVNGVARIRGFVVFVADAQVGERVRIQITNVRARAANADVLERLDAGTGNADNYSDE